MLYPHLEFSWVEKAESLERYSGQKTVQPSFGGRPPLDVDFVAVRGAVLGAWQGDGETITGIAERFNVSRAWIHKWVYPELRN